MTLTLVVETGAGLATSNAYASVAEADAYHEARLHSQAWTRAPTAKKEQALAMATRLLDAHVDWNGAKSVADSALRWPRVGVRGRDGLLIASDTVPAELKHATAEFARLLLGEDLTAEDETRGLARIRAGGGDGIALDVDKTDRAPVVPDAVMRFIAHLGARAAGRSSVRLVRT